MYSPYNFDFEWNEHQRFGCLLSWQYKNKNKSRANTGPLLFVWAVYGIDFNRHYLFIENLFLFRLKYFYLSLRQCIDWYGMVR